MASASSLGSSSKRARPPTNGTETTTMVVCLVDGCTSDLTKCKDYHRRHKVCEVHSKTPKVMVGGQEQRFCQQCSRFHLLVEFDEAKRSCRKRLDGHNRRRRKPQLEPFTISSESLFSDHQGIGLLPFGCPQLFPSATNQISMWTGAIRTDDNAKVYISHQDNNPGPVLQNQPAPEVSFGHRLNAIASSQNNETGVIDSDCALSLLSSPQQIQALGISLDHSIPLAQPIIAAGLQYNNGLPVRYQSTRMEQGPMDAVLSSDTSEPELHCQAVFHMQTEDGSEHVSPDSPQMFPFSWE